MTVMVHVPRDSASRSMGADDVARALTRTARQRGVDIAVVRNGSRGMLWLEPMIEVAVEGRRIAYGPVAEADVEGLLRYDEETAGGIMLPLFFALTPDVTAAEAIRELQTAAERGSIGRARCAPNQTTRVRHAP